jgi:hypothetical protein
MYEEMIVASEALRQQPASQLAMRSPIDAYAPSIALSSGPSCVDAPLPYAGAQIIGLCVASFGPNSRLLRRTPAG